MRLTIRVDSKAVLAGLKAARSDLNKDVKAGLTEVAVTIGVPEVRKAAPNKSGKLAGSAKGGAIAQGAYVEVKTPYAGLLEFGGVRRDVIRPKKGKALTTPAGPRANVSGPRTYKAQHYMARAVAAALPKAKPLMEEAVIRPFRRHLGG